MRHHGRNGQQRHRPVHDLRYQSALGHQETTAETVERWERDHPPAANGYASPIISSGETITLRPSPKPSAAWNNPDVEVLEETRGDLPDFPNDVLSPDWRDFVCRASHAAGVTTAHVAVPLLSIASGIIGCSYRIKAASAWLEPCSFWAAIVGYSGTGKTPGIDVPKRALSHIEKERRTKNAEIQREHETRAEAAKAAQKEWKRQIEEAIKAGSRPPPQPAEAASPGEFVRPRLYVSDATVERLAVLPQGRPSGMVVICDELAGLFANMSRYSNGSDREFWLESWNGKPHVVERMGRDPVVVDHLLVSVVGGLQPDKLVRSFEGDADGMYARIAFSWPAEPAYKPLSNDSSENEPLIINALTRLVEDLPLRTEDGQFVSSSIPLSGEAVTAFEHFRQFLQGYKAGLYGRDREWWAKGQSQVLRLAGTLTFLDWAAKPGLPRPQCVDAGSIKAAVRLWCDYFWPHSRAALRQIGLSDGHALARRVLKWIRAHRADERIVSLKDIRREALGQTIDKKKTEAVLQQLEVTGWLWKETIPTAGRARHRWRVNDLLFSSEPRAGSAGSAGRVTSSLLSALPALPASDNSLDEMGMAHP
jgi:Protein of unknown function (DUF3987)